MSNSIYGFIVGVSDYSAISGATDLPYCNNDILYFSKALRYLIITSKRVVTALQENTNTYEECVAAFCRFDAKVIPPFYED